MPTQKQRVRQTIATLCELREAEADTLKCERKADRSLNLQAALRQRDSGRRKCSVLSQRLAALERPPSAAARRRFVEGNFDAGVLATPSDLEVQCVAELGPAWCTAASRITHVDALRRVLAYLERRPAWRRHQLASSPHPAVPRFVSVDPGHATLQNLPAWQSARIALVACACARKRPSVAELGRWAKTLGIHDAYVPALRSLCKA